MTNAISLQLVKLGMVAGCSVIALVALLAVRVASTAAARRMRAADRLTVFLVAAALAAGGLDAAGRWAVARGRATLASGPARSTAVGLAAIASLAPDVHGEGLSLLGDALARRAPSEQAAGLAARSNRPLDAAHAWYSLGEFERASDALALAHGEVDPAFEARVHLLAHRYALAAAAARRGSERALASRELDADARRRSATFECVALWAAVRTGDPTALARLRSRVVEDGRLAPSAPAQCLVLLEDVLEGAERRAAFSAALVAMNPDDFVRMGYFDHHSRWLERLGLELREEADPVASSRSDQASTIAAEELLLTPDAVLELDEPAIVTAMARARIESSGEGNRLATASAAVDAAAIALAAGRTEEARQWLSIARSNEGRALDPDTMGSGVQIRRLEVETALAIEAHDDRATTNAIEGLRRADIEPSRLVLIASLTRGYFANVGQLTRALSEHPDADATAWTHAEGTDGAPLAAYLSVNESAVGVIAASFAAEHITSGRAELLDWLRRSDSRRCAGGCSLAAAAVDAHARARVAYALGARDDGDAFERTAARFSTALLMRDVAVPRRVLEHIDDVTDPREQATSTETGLPTRSWDR